MKKNQWLKRILSFALAFTLMFTSMGFQSLASYAAETDTDLTVPFGICAFEYNETNGLAFSWGNDGVYSSYEITIRCDEINYLKVYPNQQLGHPFFKDTYVPGKTYTIEVRGEKDGKVSNPGIENYTIPGDDNGGDTGSGEGEQQPAVSPYINLETSTNKTYKSQDDGGWGGDSNVTFKFEGTTATISGDNFGGNSWAVQWGLSELTSSADKNILSFDVTAENDGTLKYKLINDEGMTDIAIKAGETNHIVIKTDRKAVSPFFDLSFLGKGTNTFAKMTFAENTDADEPAAEPAEVIVADNDAMDLSVLLSSGNITTYDSQTDGGWGGNTPVSFDFDGRDAYISADSFGWNAWAVQWKLIDLTSAFDTNVFEFDVVSDKDKSFVVKNETSSVMTTVNLKAGKVYHYSELINANTISYTLDLTGGAGNLHFGNVKFAPVADFAKLNIDTYCAENDGAWGGDSNVSFNYDGVKAVINADSFGWNAWAVQWKFDLESSYETNTFEFDVVAEADKTFNVKNESTTVMKTINIKAGETYHFAENVNGKTVAYTFDLTGGGKNSLTFTNFRFGDAGTKGEAITPATKVEYDFTKDNSAYDFADPGLNKDGYKLVFADEFDGNYGENANVDANTGLNLSNWAYQLGDGTTDCGNQGWGNAELQAYTDRPENIKVNEDLTGDGTGDGLLRITAQYEDNGYVYANEGSKKYTSARIRTTKPGEALFTTTYGYVEARISLPETKGAWPAFWMLPEGAVYGGWPVSGEIDILETTGTHTNEACSTVHTGSPSQVYEGSGYVALNSDIQYFHTYAVDWEPGKLSFYYDGVKIFEKSDWDSTMSGASDALTFDAPFDVPFYMILNLAVDSGRFGGAANKAAFKDDINMYVDYVRVYQREDGYSETASKTASGDIQADWTAYKGQNLIADMTADNLVATGGGHDDAKAAGLGNWYLSTQDDAAATATTVTDANGKVWNKVDITTPGSQDYSVQLIGHYDAKAGYVYKVSFDHYAEGEILDKSVNCDSKEYKGWSTYGIKTFNTVSAAKHEEFTIVQKKSFDNCRIEFNIGARGTGSVYVSNVKVEIVDPATVGEAAVLDAKTILPDGNMVYNGTFSQGNNHTGYWTAKEGTTLSVPRYTTEALKDTDIKVMDVASKTNYEGLASGVKYYERRAQISARDGLAPTIYQHDIKMTADDYTVSFDLYSKEDTTAKIALLDENGNEAVRTTIAYKAADGVKNFSVALKATEDLGKGSLAITFAKGSSVQIDNVKMTGLNQKSAFDDTPVDADTTWRGDNGAGQELGIGTDNDGARFLDGIVSGSSWYVPQIGSSNFHVSAGAKYELSFKFKFVDAANVNGEKKIKYIVQEAGGSWAVAQDVVEVDASKLEMDEAGYYVYSTTFVSKATMDDCHINFGFGDSNVTNARFTFKDVEMNAVKTAGGVTEDMSSKVDESAFEDAKTEEKPETGNGGNTGSETENSGNTGSESGNTGSEAGNGESGSTSGGSTSSQENASSGSATDSAPSSGTETNTESAATASDTATVAPVAPTRRPVAAETANSEVEIPEEQTPLAEAPAEAAKEEAKEDTKNEVSESKTEEITAPEVVSEEVTSSMDIVDEDTALAAAPTGNAGKIVAGTSLAAILVVILVAAFVFTKKRRLGEQE